MKIPYKTITQSLMPVCAVLLYYYGFRAVLVILTSVTVCFLTKYLWNKFISRKKNEIDSKTVLTGLIIGLCASPVMPLWLVALAGIIAIVVFDELLSKIDENIISPACAMMAILFIVLPASMKSFEVPKIDNPTFGKLFYNGVSIVNGSAVKTIWSILPQVVVYVVAIGSLGYYFAMKYVLPMLKRDVADNTFEEAVELIETEEPTEIEAVEENAEVNDVEELQNNDAAELQKEKE